MSFISETLDGIRDRRFDELVAHGKPGDGDGQHGRDDKMP